MRKLTAALVVLCWFCGSANAQGISFAGGRIGFQLSFMVLGDNDPASLGFDMGATGDVAFSLGKYGDAHYKPGIGLWFSGASEQYVYTPALPALPRTEEIRYFFLEVHLDIADIAYYFPVPEHIVARPYAGFGPMIAIDHYRADDTYGLDLDDTDARVGFNLFGGADFRISNSFVITAEMRGRFSRWDVFKISGGMQFTLGRKSPATYQDTSPDTYDDGSQDTYPDTNDDGSLDTYDDTY